MAAAMEHNRKVSPKLDSPIADDAVAAGTESKLQSDIAADLRNRRWIYFQSRTDKATTTQKGTPDFIVFPTHREAFMVECKTRTGKLSPEQQAVQFVANLSGHKYVVVRSLREAKEVFAFFEPK